MLPILVISNLGLIFILISDCTFCELFFFTFILQILFNPFINWQTHQVSQSISKCPRSKKSQPRNVLQHKTDSAGHPDHGHLWCYSAATRSQPSHLSKLSILWTFSPRSSQCLFSSKLIENTLLKNQFLLQCFQELVANAAAEAAVRALQAQGPGAVDSNSVDKGEGEGEQCYSCGCNFCLARIGDFINIFHDIGGEAVAVDSKTVLIKGFTYDGEGPDTFFLAGTSGRPSSRGDVVLPWPANGEKYTYADRDIPLIKRSFDGSEDILLTLPEGNTVDQLK